MAKIDPAELERLIRLIDEKENEIGARNTLAVLLATEHARFKDGNEASLTLAGIRSSCTAGTHGLLMNWRNAARRKLDELLDPINLQGSGPAPIVPRER
jgi:hypothetical protein